ncbi:hypothetical protein RQP46_005127 [Phenoliferia psychrophenolica]
MTFASLTVLFTAALATTAFAAPLQSRATQCHPLVSAPEAISITYPQNTRASWAPDVSDTSTYDSFPGVILQPTNQMNPAGPYWTLAESPSAINGTYSITSTEDTSICISNDGTSGGALFSAPCSDNPVWVILCDTCPGDGEGTSCSFQSILHDGNQNRMYATLENESIVLRAFAGDGTQSFNF